MSRTVFVNGAYVPEEEARVSVFDRGFLFADGVYEVVSVLGTRLVDFGGHMARLRRSLGELGMGMPMEEAAFLEMHRALVARNGLDEGMVYTQVTRGAADRDFLFPPEGTAQTVVAFTQAAALIDRVSARAGIRIVTLPDIRWGRRDIKTVQLLAPSLCKMAAKRAGADDAWMVEDGMVTEGTSNNAYLVAGDTIVTRDLSASILHGITRAAVLRLAREARMRLEERAFSVEEAKAADEAFITSASTFVTPVIEIDGLPVGSGAPGPVAARRREIYIADARASAV